MFWTGLASSGSALRRAMRKWGIAVVAACGLVAGAAALARTPEQPGMASTPTVALAALPPEAQSTHRLILSGGPFPYPKDGVVFGNRERQLPAKARVQYREYTVKTPGARDRGARRIVCAGQPPTRPEACFYTDNHYASFRRITP